MPPRSGADGGSYVENENMPDKLVIVESPAKAKTIGRILGKDYVIKASYGHIRDLPERAFGVDIEHNFAPQYEESKSRGKNLAELKKTAKAVKEIYLAPDPDREGEAIAWHLHEVLKNCNKKAAFHRVAFHEITRSAITKAFQHPGDLNMNLVDAQQARRVLDRIVGYMISPLLWSRIERGVSAGRVQSVALRLVCEREREILAFVPKEYWNFLARFSQGENCEFTTRLAKIDNGKFEVGSREEADRVLAAVKGARAWKIASIETQPRKRHAPPPFITSTLQQAAGSALGFSASTTMRYAQQLYEGVDTPAGHLGLITYMRTDSVAIAVEAQNACRDFIRSGYGPEFVPEKPNFYKSKSNAQGAHEAIRPTDVTLTPDSLKDTLDAGQLKLYRLIWRRFLASQMAAAEQLRTTVDVEGCGADSRLYTFRATATVTTFPGFLKAYNIEEEGSARSEDEDSRDADALGRLREHAPCTLTDTLGEQKFTEPPPRFSEATLIKELESNGIGRPSTYATIVNTIQERAYVNKEKGKLIPTELGFKINDYLVASLPDLMQVGFTADMENQLDGVEEGKIQWTAMLKEFYEKFSRWLADAKNAGAPDAEKAQAVLKLLQDVRNWEAPEKGSKRVYDDKKFYTSVQNKAEKGAGISSKQWEALLNLVIKYADQLHDVDRCAEKYHLTDDIDAARERVENIRKMREEIQQRREEAVSKAPPQENVLALFRAMANIPWNPPEKRGARVYDDKKFFDSLKEQVESGKVLSERQTAALAKLASRYSASIAEYETLMKNLGVEVPAPNEENAGAQDEVKRILKALSEVKEWAAPEKKGRRVYDDREFYESLAKQSAAGRVLSPKQSAALMKLAAKYKIV